MRSLLLLSVPMLLTALAFGAVETKSEPTPTPLMRTVEPYMAKVGTEVTVAGDHLGANLVAEVYLTADSKNFKVEVTSQTENEVKFKVPAVKAGPYRLMVLTKSVDPVFIEEPVKIMVEE